MCECTLLVDKKTNKPIIIQESKYYSFHHIDNTNGDVNLLDGITLKAIAVDYAAAYEISGMLGIKRGYLFVYGEAEDGTISSINVEELKTKLATKNNKTQVGTGNV